MSRHQQHPILSNRNRTMAHRSHLKHATRVPILADVLASGDLLRHHVNGPMIAAYIENLPNVLLCADEGKFNQAVDYLNACLRAFENMANKG